jgi:hemin uptake protein HemP
MTTAPDTPSPNPRAALDGLPSSGQNQRVVWDSQALLSGQREVFIQHGSEFYRLILTKSGKLILQK